MVEDNILVKQIGFVFLKQVIFFNPIFQALWKLENTPSKLMKHMITHYNLALSATVNIFIVQVLEIFIHIMIVRAASLEDII